MVIKSFVLVFLAMIVPVGIVLVGDTPIKFKDLPPVVQKTMLAEANGAKIKNTLVEKEGGKTFYECETVLANGKTRDFLVDTQGKVCEVEDETEMDEIPAAVKAVVEKAAANGGKITKLEVAKVNAKVVRYEASIVKKGKKSGLEINPDGSLVK
jgi:uncharacterized membrane protein YkoI